MATKRIQEIDDYVVAKMQQWRDELKAQKPNRNRATRFILEAMDDLINTVEPVAIPSGADKKAIVLLALSTIYDLVTLTTLPLWLKPFAGLIESFLINIVISELIDLYVAKYHNGIWKLTVSKQ